MLAASFVLTAAALGIDACFGYPNWLFRMVRHPVVWVGSLISALDRMLNATGTRGPGLVAVGVVALVVVVGVSGGIALGVQAIPGWPGLMITLLLAATLPAQRSLHQHVAAVAAGLRVGLAEGRAAVSQIVGRDPEQLDQAGVARAAIESLAENFADGVVGPAFWGAVAGLPGMAIYKAVNTADSMIGHRTVRYERFGWAAARFDDLVNLPVSRLASVWLMVAALIVPGASVAGAWRAVWRDAGHHRSPNAGWPEAAMAGALGFRLAGPRSYGGVVVADGFMGDGRAELDPADIGRALALYRIACLVQFGVIAGVALMLRG